ncbi:MAG: hypothetical protein A2W85_13440 [Bacteroidetes bacterium GWF2_41_31]|nr:MAG: hypothetical protein A2W85_13440 [Bacteroidetes bacterium GWF2_41_31]OFZ02320.1 MAG: hypothetical protein A2338_02725 [Bacteroidetes bacterium RIFOXYB12_FULL_41_6]
MVNRRLIDFTEEDLIVLFRSLLDEKLTADPERFINEEEAMKLLNCGKTQMYYYRVKGIISYVQDKMHPKMIQYDRESINEYLGRNLVKAFNK